MMTGNIRPAQPNAEDAAAFAALANMAAHDLIADMFGKNYPRILGQMFLRCGNLFSHRLVHFAEVNGKVTGLLHAFHALHKADMDGKTTLLLMRYTGLGLISSLLTRFRLRLLLNFMDALPPEAYYLQCIAVYPQFRGQGLSKLLLAKADDLARLENSRTVELDVETDNMVAMNAYQGHGMCVASSSPVLYFQKQKRNIALHRMVKTLA
jgi:GNAT superfamily N-acetyltransferase